MYNSTSRNSLYWLEVLKFPQHFHVCRKGSVIVNFVLTHEVYDGSTARSMEEMDRTLTQQLRKDRLGEYKASMDNYKFEKLSGGQSKSMLSLTGCNIFE